MSTLPLPLPRFDVVELCQEATERAGVEFRAGYDLVSARRSLQLLMIEWANRGLNLWTLEAGSVLTETDVGYYTLPEDTIDVLDVSVRSTSTNSTIWSTTPLQRIGVGDWPHWIDRTRPGKPNSYFVHRTVEPPTLYLTPVPNSSGPYSVSYWRLRYMAPLPRGGEGLPDVPLRLVPALISGLAFQIALKSRDRAIITERLPVLKQLYEAEFEMASQEDRDRVSFFFIPGPNDRCSC